LRSGRLPKKTTVPGIGDEGAKRHELVVSSSVKTGGTMPHLQSRRIGLHNVYSNISLPDSLAIVNDDSIHGAGLVVTRSLRCGELILPLFGKLTARSYRTIQIDIGKHLDGALIRFINHSCRPTSIVNVRIQGVLAALDLKAGDEVTFFYPSTEWKMARPFNCLCNAPECIGFVGGARYLSVEVLSRYLINSHIQYVVGHKPPHTGLE
jgi:hypothetical protein